MHENDGGVTVQAMGRQRCRILTRRSAVNGMPYGEVRVLEEVELPPISRALQPISFSRLSSSKNLRYCAAITSHSYFALKMSLTGATAFSYWVAANLPIDMETRLRLLTEPCTDRRLIDIIICKNCGSTLCRMEHMITGYVHDLFTVSEVTSTTARGQPSAEYSWFPGYKWTIHECANCGQHVGWRFTSSKLLPASFFGLTRSAIRPADSRHPVASNVQRIEQLAIV
ncbi:unnamed protein product [Gongylonema pulchrum]|uniref:CULT domain-containing protein n=1 Tax=Gongylonema pulchrum TaxID=637853 RepID=A0A3P7NH54_9BILA|nr:unnamed protein product [Gongylonema pulchrum]